MSGVSSSRTFLPSSRNRAVARSVDCRSQNTCISLPSLAVRFSLKNISVRSSLTLTLTVSDLAESAEAGLLGGKGGVVLLLSSLGVGLSGASSTVAWYAMTRVWGGLVDEMIGLRVDDRRLCASMR